MSRLSTACRAMTSSLGARRSFSDACAFTRFEHERWEGAVNPYDRIFGRLTAHAARDVVQHVMSRGPAGPGLDCATGPGYVVEEALRRGAAGSDLVGCDFSGAMLRRARERVPDAGVEWLEADIQEPLPEAMQGRFAWCSCNFGVLHLARPEDFFQVARQVLRPGGLFVFTVWADLARSPAFQIPLQAIERHGSMDVGLPPGPPFFKYSDPKVATDAVVAAGFDASSVSADLVDMRWELDKPEELWTVFLEGTARTGGMLERQRPEARAAIEQAMRDAVEKAQQGSGTKAPPYVLSQPCLRVSAAVPA